MLVVEQELNKEELMNLNRVRILAVFMALFLIVSCTPKKIVLTPEQEKDRGYYERILVHATAVQKFAEAVVKYNIHYNAADAQTKAWLTENLDPLWIQASDALDVWEAAIKGGQTGEDEIMTYKRLKSAILLKLPDLIWSD